MIYYYKRYLFENELNLSILSNLNKTNGMKIEKTFLDKVAITSQTFPERENLIKILKSDDKVIVDNFHSLSSSINDLIKILKIVRKLNVNIITSCNNEEHDYNKISNLIHYLIICNDFQKGLMIERVKISLEEKKRYGWILGRPQTEQHKVDLAFNLVSQANMTIVKACQIVGICRATYYKFTKK